VATGVHLSAAVRHDINQLFADDTTWRVTSAWEIPATPVKLRASYGTGVAKPGFYEMFGFDPTSFRGNPALKPERSRGWDVGADVALGKRGRFALSYFDANLRDEIVTDFTVFPFTTRNLAGASSRRGVEASLRYAPVPALALAASYGFTDSKDDKGVQEVRRPRNVASVSATGTLLGDRLHVGVSVDYNGAMVDLSFVPASPGRVVLKAYALTTATAAYRLTDHVELFGRIENLFDADYQEVFSYNHLGRGAYGGVKVRFGG
jgi:vitamin B12 transporter